MRPRVSSVLPRHEGECRRREGPDISVYHSAAQVLRGCGGFFSGEHRPKPGHLLKVDRSIGEIFCICRTLAKVVRGEIDHGRVVGIHDDTPSLWRRIMSCSDKAVVQGCKRPLCRPIVEARSTHPASCFKGARESSEWDPRRECRQNENKRPAKVVKFILECMPPDQLGCDRASVAKSI